MITERRAAAYVGALCLALLATRAPAHTVAPEVIRELVRIQGYRAPAPRGVEVERELTLVVLGTPLRLAATEWRLFGFSDPAGRPTPAEPPQLMLQGERPLLHRIATAHADQRMTILAERRPGGDDLFVLTVDLCPEK